MTLYPKRLNSLLGAARAAGALGDEPQARDLYQALLDVAGDTKRQPALEEALNYTRQRQ
jgi:hypothetical protein